MESDDLSIDEMRTELTRARKMAIVCELAGEEDGANVYRSTERALITGLDRAGIRNA